MADMEVKKSETIDSGNDVRLFTQDEVNKIVRDRLARERQKSQVEELLEEEPDVTEETALPEIDETDKKESKEKLPDEISTMFGDIVLDNENDIAAFRRIFGAEHDGDERAMRHFLDLKEYAEAHGTEIEPADDLTVSRWKAKSMEGHYIPITGTVTAANTLSEAADNLMRNIFGLPQKQRGK